MSLTQWHNHWPGGIPSSIRRHEEPVEGVASASRAWRHFVREQWLEGAAMDEQRRALIKRWATADQEFRNVSFSLNTLSGRLTFLLILT
jgi:hypothetical protein